MTGIVSWGTYISTYRYYLGDGRKKMALFDPRQGEDVLTMAYEASRSVFQRANVDPSLVTYLSLGRENTPYSVKPLAVILKDLLGIPNYCLTEDIAFACLGGIQAMLNSSNFINSGYGDYALAVATDYSIYPEGSKAECTQGSGSAAFLLGDSNVFASIDDIAFYSTDTMDFWKLDGDRYPNFYGEFTERTYLDHVLKVGLQLPSKHSRYVVFHMPYKSLPTQAARELELSEDQYIQPLNLISRNVGNAYTASVLLGLAWALENSEKGDLVTAIGYGSGAGSLGMTFKLREDPKQLTARQQTVSAQIERGIIVDERFYRDWREATEPVFRTVGRIRPESNKYLTRLVCPDCGSTYSTQSTATKIECPRDKKELITVKHPLEGTLEYSRKILPNKLTDAIINGEAVILDKGKDLRLTVRRMYTDIEQGPIYGAAYLSRV